MRCLKRHQPAVRKKLVVKCLGNPMEVSGTVGIVLSHGVAPGIGIAMDGDGTMTMIVGRVFSEMSTGHGMVQARTGQVLAVQAVGGTGLMLVHSKVQGVAVPCLVLRSRVVCEVVKGEGIPWQLMESTEVIGLSRALREALAVIRGVQEWFKGTIKVG